MTFGWFPQTLAILEQRNVVSKFKFLAVIAVMLIASSLELLGVVALGSFVDFVLDSDSSTNVFTGLLGAILERNYANQIAFLATAAAIVTASLGSIWCAWTVAIFAQKLSTSLGNAVFSQMLNSGGHEISAGVFSNNMNLLVNEVERTANLVILPSINLVSKSVLLVFLCAAIFLENVELSLVIVTMIILGYGSFFIAIRNFSQRLGERVSDGNVRRVTAASNGLSLLREIFAFNKQKFFLDRFSEPGALLAKTQAQMSAILQMPRFAVECGLFLALAVLVYYSTAPDSMEASFDPGLIAMILAVSLKSMVAIQHCYASIVEIKANKNSLNTVLNFLARTDKTEAANALVKSFQAIAPLQKAALIELCNVTVSGDSGTPLLKDINLNIRHNSILVIIGRSGSGKTTLLSTLMGLLRVESGNIIVRGRSFEGSQFRMHQLQKSRLKMGYVGQEPKLLEGGVLENIGFGLTYDDISYDSVCRVLELAGLSEVLGALSKEELSDFDCKNLSGGEKQRVAIARALYAKADVLLLDEPSSALDRFNTSLLKDVLLQLKPDIAIVLVTHDRSLMEIADRFAAVSQCGVTEYDLLDGLNIDRLSSQ